MTFLLYISGLILIGAISLFVAAPLFKPEQESSRSDAREDLAARWEKQKTDAYAAIREADFDQEMGKLTGADYRLLREKYEARALEALAQLDRSRAPGEKQS